VFGTILDILDNVFFYSTFTNLIFFSVLTGGGCCDSYEIMVIASDGGEPPKSGSMIVSIKVVDVNDNAPLFDNSTYEVTHHHRRRKCTPPDFDT